MKTLNTFLLCIFFANNLISQVNIPLNDANISYDGVFYPEISASKVVLNRHLPEMINNWESGIGGSWINQWVITQSGVRIRFKTSSPSIDMEFIKREGGGAVIASPTSGFSVFVNGVSIKSFSSLSFSITNPNPGTATIFEVSLPNLFAVDFTGLKLNNGYSLENPGTLNKPVYVSIGNSITHGTGQYVSSAKTYPFILANKMGWDLHNLAVAGSTLGWAIALNTKGKKVDYITIKIGFNDWKYMSDPLSDKKAEYAKLLDTLRAYHPSAKIFCISPIFSSDPSGKAPYSLADFRTMVNELVTERMATDNLLCLIKGIEITNASMLAPGDPTHLSESGAAKLADSLFVKIKNSDCITTGISEIKSSKSSIKVNAVNQSFISFSTSKLGNYSLAFIDLSGKEVYKSQIDVEMSPTTINWEGYKLSKGIYILKIYNESLDSYSHKFILE